METRPISPGSATSPSNLTAATAPSANAAAAAYFKRQQHQHQHRCGSSSGSSLGRISGGIAGPVWSAVVSFDQAFRPAPPRSTGARRRRFPGPLGPLLSLTSLASRSSSSGVGRRGGGGCLPSSSSSSYSAGEDAALLQLERVDGQPFRTVDRLFLGLFDRPRRLARLPFSVPRHFFSWRSLWDLYQALRQSVHQLCPPHAPAPAVLILPLIGLVYRRETGPCVFVSDDSARKVPKSLDGWDTRRGVGGNTDKWMDAYPTRPSHIPCVQHIMGGGFSLCSRRSSGSSTTTPGPPRPSSSSASTSCHGASAD